MQRLNVDDDFFLFHEKQGDNRPNVKSIRAIEMCVNLNEKENNEKNEKI